MYKDNNNSEVMFLDKMADDLVYNFSSILDKSDIAKSKKDD
jgi:hypothetical protein